MSELSRAVTALRKVALSYPEAAEDFPWGERTIKIPRQDLCVSQRGRREAVPHRQVAAVLRGRAWFAVHGPDPLSTGPQRVGLGSVSQGFGDPGGHVPGLDRGKLPCGRENPHPALPGRLKRSPGTKAPLAWADGPGKRGRERAARPQAGEGKAIARLRPRQRGLGERRSRHATVDDLEPGRIAQHLDLVAFHAKLGGALTGAQILQG